MFRTNLVIERSKLRGIRPSEIEEMMQERGITVDHATINRWVLKYSPLLETEAKKHRKPISGSWRLDETCQAVFAQSD